MDDLLASQILRLLVSFLRPSSRALSLCSPAPGSQGGRLASAGVSERWRALYTHIFCIFHIVFIFILSLSHSGSLDTWNFSCNSLGKVSLLEQLLLHSKHCSHIYYMCKCVCVHTFICIYLFNITVLYNASASSRETQDHGPHFLHFALFPCLLVRLFVTSMYCFCFFFFLVLIFNSPNLSAFLSVFVFNCAVILAALSLWYYVEW